MEGVMVGSDGGLWRGGVLEPNDIIFRVKGAAETDAIAEGRPTSSGTGTVWSQPKLLLIPPATTGCV